MFEYTEPSLQDGWSVSQYSEPGRPTGARPNGLESVLAAVELDGPIEDPQPGGGVRVISGIAAAGP